MAHGFRIFSLIAALISMWLPVPMPVRMAALTAGGLVPVLWPDAAAAQERVVQPRLERRSVWIPDIDTEDFEAGVYAGIMNVEDFGSHTIYGARLAYHITTGLFAEAAYGQTEVGKTSYEVLSGGARLLTDGERRLRYYNLSLGYNLLPGETFLTRNRAFTSDFYLIAGIGSTRFAGDARFTVNFGAGYRLLATDWLALHVDVRDHLFDMDLLGEDERTHNIEISAGTTVFF